jgi:hypothetical protein
LVELVRSTPEEIQRQLSLSSSQNLSASSNSSSPSDSPDQGNIRRSARTKKTAAVESAAQELVRSTAGAKKVSRTSSAGPASDSAGAKRTAKRAYKRMKDPMVITRVGDLDQSVEVITTQMTESRTGSTPLTDEELAAMMQQEELMAAAADAEERGEIFTPPDVVSLNAAVHNLSISGESELHGSTGGRSLAHAMEILPEQEASPSEAEASATVEELPMTTSIKPPPVDVLSPPPSTEAEIGAEVSPAPVADTVPPTKPTATETMATTKIDAPPASPPLVEGNKPEVTKKSGSLPATDTESVGTASVSDQ